MRKAILFLLIFGVIMSFGISAFADMEEKVSNHWSKSLIEKDFFLYYFPYLAKEDFKRFEPNGIICEDEFLLSFSSSNALIGINRDLTRAEMAKTIGKKLMEIKLIEENGEKLPFIDINSISTEEHEGIASLYRSGIIQGQSKTIFNPKGNVTQAEALIVLQRVNKLLNKVSSIPFKLSGAVQAYSGNEGITSKTEGDKILVTITKEFPTPGYSLEVKEILKNKGNYKINLSITPPDKDSIQLQVITYKIITIEIDKNQLGNPPYNFVLEDFFCLK